MAPEALPDPVAVAVDFTGVLEGLGVPHLIGGSLASSVHGEPRSTNDIDVLADLEEEHVAAFVQAVKEDYYVSPEAEREAIGVQGYFNVIHTRAVVKVDVFIAGQGGFNQERLRLRQRVRISSDSASRMYVDTAEHSVLRKLEWFRRGGEVSVRQWRDVVSIIRVQGQSLDHGRLDAWAVRLDVVDLLERARSEAGTAPPS